MTPARTLLDVLYEGDRRALTSRANLEGHIPSPLDPEGTVVLSVRIPLRDVDAIDRARGERSRSEYLRELIRLATTQ